MKRYFLTGIIIAIICSSFFTNIAYPADNSEYKIHSADVLMITVYGQPDLATKTRISTDG